MAQEFCNPFKSEDTMEFELEQGLFVSEKQGQSLECSEILSNMISINKDYKKLSQTYQDVKKLSNTYIDTTNTQSVSKLESKLNRYYP